VAKSFLFLKQIAAPLLAAASSQLVANGGAINFTPTLLAGVSVTYSATGLPTGASISSSTGAITGTLSTNGKWVVEITATNGVGSDKTWVPVSVYSSTANISQSSGFPFYCDTANRKYTLTEDIEADGTALAIIAANVSVDLNGHTITYDNATPITIANGSFETGTGGAATGWSFTNAPNAARFAGAYINNEVYDGSYSLKFSNTTATEWVDSTGTITLESGVTYSLSAMFEYGGAGEDTNPGVKGYVQLFGSGLTTIEVSQTATNSRGIQLVEYEFTTGDTGPYYCRAGIVGHASGTVPFYIDDIKIQRTKTYGITTQSYLWSAVNYPQLTQYGQGTGTTITNGSITQGGDKATWGHGVFVQENDAITIGDVSITVNGPNASAIYGQGQSTQLTYVIQNVLESSNRTITSRDNSHGSVVMGLAGRVASNTINNGPHMGIRMVGTVPSHVCDNTIQLKSKYTNSFAIVCGSAASQVYRNTINCGSGDYIARGIMINGGDSTGVRAAVHHNTIDVQGSDQNQEYEGPMLGGAYGIQIEDTKHLDVYDNTITARATATTAYGFRCNPSDGAIDDIQVYDNTITAISNGTYRAACLKFSEMAAGEVAITNCRLITNDGIVGQTADSVVTVAGCNLLVNTPVMSTPHPFEADYTTTVGVHTTITFSGTTFSNGASQTYFENAQAYIEDSRGGAVTTDFVVGVI
jgi:hypothetical protein